MKEKILIIDDNDIFAAALQEALSDDYEVEPFCPKANYVAEGFARIKKAREPCKILLNLNIGRGHRIECLGFDIMKEVINEIDSGVALSPFIIFTLENGAQLQKKFKTKFQALFLSAPGYDFVQVPFELTELKGKIGKSKARRPEDNKNMRTRLFRRIEVNWFTHKWGIGPTKPLCDFYFKSFLDEPKPENWRDAREAIIKNGPLWQILKETDLPCFCRKGRRAGLSQEMEKIKNGIDCLIKEKERVVLDDAAVRRAYIANIVSVLENVREQYLILQSLH